MTARDRDRIANIEKTFLMNFKLTHLYASYLEHAPEAITSEMIEALCEGGDITPREAFVAFLCELFGIDADRSAFDRRIIREYLNPSVRVLDASKYENDPYYQNIRIENVKDGAWEIRLESYKPYRGVICADIEIHDDFTEIPPLGFFEREFRFPAVLEDGNEWMTLTPVDLDTCTDAIKRARGEVVTFGLGLGYYAYMASEKENVKSVTVVEKSPEAIRLFEKYILPQFSNKDKIKIVNSDAFEYAEHIMPKEKFDFAFVDTWRDASDGAPMYKRMKALEHLSPSTEFSYWIESFLVSRLRAEKFAALTDKLLTNAPDAPKSADEFISRLSDVLAE